MIFGHGRIAKIFVAATVVFVAEHIVVLSDAAIAGRVFGSSALGAMALVIPMFSIATLVSVLFAFGVTAFRSAAFEKSDFSLAIRVSWLGLVVAPVVGLVTIGFATLVEYPYLNLFSANECTLEYFEEYWSWFPLVILLKFIGSVMICYVYSDGGRRLCVCSYVAHFFTNLFFAYTLCVGIWIIPGQEMEGISLGTVIAYAIGIAVLLRPLLVNRRRHFDLLEKNRNLQGGDSVNGRYDVLRGSQMTLGDLDGVIELDRISLDSCYQVSAGDDYMLFKDNPENGLIIRDRATGQIVGYSMLLPIRQDMYEKIKTGTFVDTDFKPEMTFRYGKPGIYHLYFASIVVHPDHRSAAMVLTMLDAMVEDFIRLAKRGIWFSDMIADVVSNDGAKFCRLFGLKKVCETNHNSSIYEVSGLPPGIRETTPATKRLVSIYRRKYATL